jgi:ribosome-associated protein
MSEPLVINERIIIPATCLTLSAVRSSGPGGQNVNKVSSKIELRFNPSEYGKFSVSVLKRLMTLAGNKIDKNGNIVIISQKFREQHRNIKDARNKLLRLILKALKPPKIRKPTKPSKASVEKRLLKKKKQSQKKSDRQKKWSD